MGKIEMNSTLIVGVHPNFMKINPIIHAIQFSNEMGNTMVFSP